MQSIAIHSTIFYRVSQKKVSFRMLLKPENPSKIQCCRTKFSHGHGLGELDPSFSLIKKGPKNKII